MTRLTGGVFALLLSLNGQAVAAEILGEWLVKDQTARIGIAACPPPPGVAPATVPGPASASVPLCGNIVWTKAPGGFDDNNPDPTKRTRPVLGLEILQAMKQTGPNKWEGSVYNAENGKTYKAVMSLESADALRMEGCVFGGLICGGETWSRFKDVAAARPKEATGTLQKAKAPPRP